MRSLCTLLLSLFAVLTLSTAVRAEIPADQLAACDARFVSQTIPDAVAPVSELADIDSWLTRFVSWNVNPRRVKVADFNFQFVVADKDGSPLNYAPAPFGRNQIHVVLKHKRTSKCGTFGTRPLVRSHYATAGSVVALAE
jgi:hypothetical protein